ncbi:MAG: transposase [Proteobacteria bacterium]|nr:transposase [Pseudomonadota bacterium]
MITEKVAREHACQFRADVYGTFQKRADAVFELIDALSSDTQARSPAELSLSPFFRRQYPSIYDGLDEWQYEAAALETVFLQALPKPKSGGFRLWGLDETPRRRQYAYILKDRGYVYVPNSVAGNKPVTIGYNYSVLAYIGLQGPSTWAPPWMIDRTPTDWTGVDRGLEQVIHLSLSDEGHWHVFVN